MGNMLGREELIRRRALRRQMASTRWISLSEEEKQVCRNRYRLHEHEMTGGFLPLQTDSALDVELKFALWKLKISSDGSWNEQLENDALLVIVSEKQRNLRLASMPVDVVEGDENAGDDENVSMAKMRLSSANRRNRNVANVLRHVGGHSNNEALTSGRIRPVGITIFDF